MNPDPGMDGLNHYAYANCNPIMFSDPTGTYVPIAEIIITIVAIIIAAVVGTVCAYVANHNGGQGSAASVTGSGSVGIGSGSSSSGGSSSDGGVSGGGGSGGSSGGGTSNNSDPSDNVVVNNSDYSSGNGGNKYIFSYNVFKSVCCQEESVSDSVNVNEEAILEALSISPKSVVSATAQGLIINANVNPGNARVFGQEFLFPTIVRDPKDPNSLNIACFGTEIINGMSIKYTELTGKPLTDKLAKEMANATIKNGSIVPERGLINHQKFMDAAWGVLANSIFQNYNGKLTGSWAEGSGPYHLGYGDRYNDSGEGFLHWELILSNTRTVNS